MVRKIRIIHKIRRLVRRVTARPALRRAVGPPAQQTEAKHVKRPSELPENPIRGLPHPDYHDKSPKDNGWRNT
jgi:hypothetical protein